MTTKTSVNWLTLTAVAVCLSSVSISPALASGMDNPLLNFAFQLSYYGLPVCLVLLIVLLILKKLKSNKRQEAVANAANDTTAQTGTDVGNAVTATSDSANVEQSPESQS